MQQPTQPTLREFDFGYYITHYANLLWRWKWYILTAAPLCALAFVIYFINFGTQPPELEAAVMLGLENSASKSAVADLGESNQQSRLALIKAKGFLSEIVNQLSLRLVLKGVRINQVFDSISVDSLAPPARYQIKVEENRYQIFYWSRALGIKEKLVESGVVSDLSVLSLPGVSCTFSAAFLKMPFSFGFSIIRQRDAIGMLLKNLTVYDKGLANMRGAERDNFVGISLTGRDYPRITKTINTIADEFVAKNLGFKKRKTNETIAILAKQLQAASEQVATTQDAVREFRNKNPGVGLAADLQGTISNMALIESSMYTTHSSVEDAQKLQAQLSAASEADQDMLLNEALLFLSRQGVLAASVVQVELNGLLQEKVKLSVGYDKSHPLVTQNRQKIADVLNKVKGQLAEFINSSANQTFRQSSKIQEITARLNGLPSQQLQLAELERKAQVAAEINSVVLTKYNQAKISDAVEVPDVFIMDYAIEPEPLPTLKDLLMVFGIGFFAILFITFGPAIAMDLIDQTARTEGEVVKFLPYTFLESIPVVGVPGSAAKLKKREKSGSQKAQLREIDPKLVTAAYTPDFTNELFRSLRSKIMLRMHDTEKKHILITSMGMNEGKSLICANLAITMAQQKLRTVLIDGDIRRGVQHNTFVLNKKPGLADFLFAEEEVTPDSVRALLQLTHVPNLSLISSGPNVPNPSELLSSKRLQALLDVLSTMADIIILDTPPLGVSVDAAIANELFSGCVVVIKAGSTNVIQLKKRLKEFPSIQKKIIGLVLNQSTLDSNIKKYKYYSYLY